MGLRIDGIGTKPFYRVVPIVMKRKRSSILKVVFSAPKAGERLPPPKLILPGTAEQKRNQSVETYTGDIETIGPGRHLVYLLLENERIVTSEQEWQGKWFGKEMNSAKGVWQYSKARLCRYKSIPLSKVHLYLAEVAWLLNNGEKDRVGALIALAKATPADMKR